MVSRRSLCSRRSLQNFKSVGLSKVPANENDFVRQVPRLGIRQRGVFVTLLTLLGGHFVDSNCRRGHHENI